MTETLLLKLEEKMMALLAELEEARHEIQRLNEEKMALNSEKESYSKKIADIVSMLDSVDEPAFIHEQATAA